MATPVSTDNFYEQRIRLLERAVLDFSNRLAKIESRAEEIDRDETHNEDFWKSG